MRGGYPELLWDSLIEYQNDFFDSPGRFFATTELKCMMGHILLNYDIKWSNRDFMEGGYYPPSKPFGVFKAPNEDTTIMFRRRIQV